MTQQTFLKMDNKENCLTNDGITRAIMVGVDSADWETSAWIKESGKKVGSDDNSTFICKKEDEAIVGRCHIGDENGDTAYRYGKLSFIYKDDAKKYDLLSGGIKQSDYMKESDSDFQCPPSHLIVGREHQGDENGKTRYYYRKFYLQDKTTKELFDFDAVADGNDYTVEKKESLGEWVEKLVDVPGEKTFYAPMFGREHYGDENAATLSHFTFLSFTEFKNK